MYEPMTPPPVVQEPVDEHDTTFDRPPADHPPKDETAVAPSTHADSHKPVSQPFDEAKDDIIINNSNHYTYLLVVTSDAASMERRRLIREKYFGLRNNLLPCMKFNTDIFYKFWIHGGAPKPDTPLRRQYEAEKMEWNDLAELPVATHLSQANVINWVETKLAAEDITYDYLIIQDINTFVRLESVKHELDSGVIGGNTESPFTINSDAPTNIVWGTFRGDERDNDAVVVGARAIKLALEHRQEIEAASEKGETLLTGMYKYFQALDAAATAPSSSSNADDKDPEAEALERGLKVPEFIREDGPDVSPRFIRWENNVESVHTEDIVVSQVYQGAEFIDLARWTHLNPVRVCYRSASRSASQLPLEPLDDDEDVEQLLKEQHDEDAEDGDSDDDMVNVDDDGVQDTKINGKHDPSTFAVVTSSFIYDACMEPSATRAAQNKRDYALKHGYSFVARSAEFAQEAARGQRKTVWGKVDVIEKVLPKYEWLFWLDMDAVIMNQDRRLEDLLEDVKQRYPYGAATFDERVDLVIARPHRDPMINAGVFLIRNTPWAMQFLREVQRTTSWFQKGSSYEQGAMWDIMRKSEHEANVFLLDRDDHTFNTFPSYYKSGDFVVHFAPDKCPNDATVKGLNAADKILAGETVTKTDLE
ncbi:galactosyl transferase GMA12/MNN10 family-domain-containing protein [Gongronella butleri]|nr:galactosyl transferase GMA12/MNN10 family-domain-containing protein [Gongronella butleri]